MEKWYMNMYYIDSVVRRYGIFGEGKQIAVLKEKSAQEPDWSDNQEANARLMAAVVDLLEACKVALAEGTFNRPEPIIVIKKAIAKAEEGRE